MSAQITSTAIKDRPTPDTVTVELTIASSQLPKLHAFMASDVWDEAEAARKANIQGCIDSLQYILRFALERSCSGSRVMATVLASLYNGNRVKFDVSELRLLDPANFEHVMNVMRLCFETSREPHTFFENGGKYFEQLISDYGLEKKRRGAR